MAIVLLDGSALSFRAFDFCVNPGGILLPKHEVDQMIALHGWRVDSAVVGGNSATGMVGGAAAAAAAATATSTTVVSSSTNNLKDASGISVHPTTGLYSVESTSTNPHITVALVQHVLKNRVTQNSLSYKLEVSRFGLSEVPSARSGTPLIATSPAAAAAAGSKPTSNAIQKTDSSILLPQQQVEKIQQQPFPVEVLQHAVKRGKHFHFPNIVLGVGNSVNGKLLQVGSVAKAALQLQYYSSPALHSTKPAAAAAPSSGDSTLNNNKTSNSQIAAGGGLGVKQQNPAGNGTNSSNALSPLQPQNFSSESRDGVGSIAAPLSSGATSSAYAMNIYFIKPGGNFKPGQGFRFLMILPLTEGNIANGSALQCARTMSRTLQSLNSKDHQLSFLAIVPPVHSDAGKRMLEESRTKAFLEKQLPSFAVGVHHGGENDLTTAQHRPTSPSEVVESGENNNTSMQQSVQPVSIYALEPTRDVPSPNSLNDVNATTGPFWKYLAAFKVDFFVVPPASVFEIHEPCMHQLLALAKPNILIAGHNLQE